MRDPLAGDRRTRLLGHVECYGLYAALVVLSVGNFLWWRGTAELMIASLVERKAIEALAGPFLHGVLMLLIGAGLFVLVLFAEPYLRAGVARYQTRRRFVRLAVPLVAMLVFGLVIRSIV